MSFFPWNVPELLQPPQTWPAPQRRAPGVQSLFFENVPWQGRPTQVFAWMGMPYQPSKSSLCPGMVLLHGGGGTAFDEWVRIWNRRGYAAIAIDQCGCVPEHPAVQEGVGHQRIPAEWGFHAGPPGWDASFLTTDQPVEDQWPYHAVAAAIRAWALLAAQPGVDPLRIGVTGISWGGYLTSLVSGAVGAGISPTHPGPAPFACSIPVYGCGHLGYNSVWKDTGFSGVSPAQIARWMELWDPSAYLASARLPMCWVSGTNDFAYPLDSLQKSYQMPKGDCTLCIRVEMPHSHTDGWAPAEIGIYADSQLRGGAPLPRLLRQGCDGKALWAEFDSARPLLAAEINYTRACGQWQDRKFSRLPAQLNPATGWVEASIPPNTTVCFLNVFDDRGCVASTPHR
jgi:dienelactone hydrolase